MTYAEWYEMFFRLLDGLGRTVLLLFLATVLSYPIALAMANAGNSRHRVLSYFSRSYVFVFRGTPALVQLFFIYYGFSMSEYLRSTWAWAIFQDAWACGIIALTLNTAAYQTEIFRGAFAAVPREMIEAARSLGLSRFHLFWIIRFPLAFRIALPAYGNELILVAKATSIVSTITILDLMGMAKLIYTETFDPFAPLLTAAVLYLVLTWMLQFVISRTERLLSLHV